MPIYKGSQNQGLIYYGSPNTNCLTSVPKNVNLSLSNGTLTLKAGSKVYVPNGFESDGTTPKFDEVVIGSDITADTKGYSGLYCYNTAGWFTILSDTVSGSSLNNPFTLQGWYDTANNIIKRYHQQEGWQQPFSFPICKVTSDGTSITSINQIFDWCGFIGSSAFVLPGVKGLIPNGFNANGTYKSIEFTTDRVLATTRTWDIPASSIQKLFIYNRGKALGIQNYQIESDSMPTANDWAVWYNPKENIQRWNNSSNTLTDISQWAVDTTMRYVGEIPSDGTSKITSLIPATVQPLQIGRLITNVYKGSTLVYSLGFDPVTFTESGTWTVPAGIRKIAVDCVAASGSSSTSAGGKGGRVQCVLNVTSGQVLHIVVGKVGANYNASDIRTDPEDLNSRLVVAGAGGNGTGGIGVTAGAAGGGLVGASAGGVYYYAGGSGGTQTAGGSVGGTFGFGGSSSGGHGGAGWYGGGAGQSGLVNKVGTCSAGGGGGSSYTHPELCSEVVHTQGFQSGNGYITISMV